MHTLASSRRTTAHSTADVQVKWRDVILFCLLAYGLSWAWLGVKIAPHLGTLLSSSVTPADATVVFGNPLYHVVGMFGPLLAAVIMRLVVSKEGLHGSLGLRRPWRNYLLAVCVPIAFFGVVGLLAGATGLAQFAWPEGGLPLYVLPLLAGLLVAETLVALGEEYGWRGYLLPRLLPLGEIPATLLLGLIWSVWHLPVVVAGVLYSGHNLWLTLLVFGFATTMVAFLYTWFAVASRNSAAVASVLHGGGYVNHVANKKCSRGSHRTACASPAPRR